MNAPEQHAAASRQLPGDWDRCRCGHAYQSHNLDGASCYYNDGRTGGASCSCVRFAAAAPTGTEHGADCPVCPPDEAGRPACPVESRS